MRYNEFGIVECNVFCENRTLATLGVSSETWLPFSFDLSEVQAIKPASETALDQQGVEACTHVFFKGVHECMAIDVPYEELRRLWIAHKARR